MDFAEQTVFAVSQDSANTDWEALEHDCRPRVPADPAARRARRSGHRRFDGVRRSRSHPRRVATVGSRRARRATQHGKDRVGLNIAQTAALAGVGVGVFSLEMSSEALATRMLCSQARVDASKVRTGFLSRDRDWPRLTRAAEELYQIPLFIDDCPACRSRRSAARRGGSRRSTRTSRSSWWTTSGSSTATRGSAASSM
jgi:replicative DNA helicase